MREQWPGLHATREMRGFAWGRPPLDTPLEDEAERERVRTRALSLGKMRG